MTALSLSFPFPFHVDERRPQAQKPAFVRPAIYVNTPDSLRMMKNTEKNQINEANYGCLFWHIFFKSVFYSSFCLLLEVFAAVGEDLEAFPEPVDS